MKGGTGQDLVSYGDKKKGVSADLDGARDDGEKGERDLIGSDVEDLDGGKGADTLSGNGKSNWLYGDDGKDVLRGGSGMDFLTGGFGDDTMSGGDGVDRVNYWDHVNPVVVDLDGATGDDGQAGEKDTISIDVENLWGGDGADTLTGHPEGSFLFGDRGNDVLRGLDEGDLLLGGDGADDLSGGGGEDTASYFHHSAAVTADLDGAQGDDGHVDEGDTIRADIEGLEGGSGNDTLIGNDGDNYFYGKSGNDTINGAGGDDYVLGEAGRDVLNGGDGRDVVSYLTSTKPVTADLDGAPGDDGQSGEGDTIATDVEGLEGGTAADTLTGNAENNDIWGGAGNDVIRGGAGNDVLKGSNGNDRLYGDDGDDDLIGEPGNTPETAPGPGDKPGSNTATDRVDGGANTATGDGCFVRTAGTKVNCERAVGAAPPVVGLHSLALTDLGFPRTVGAEAEVASAGPSRAGLNRLASLGMPLGVR